MKVFISADMEGITGISRWEDVRTDSGTYARSTERFTQELFLVEVDYLYHYDAYNASYYPGVEKMAARSVLFESKSIYDVMTTLKFII